MDETKASWNKVAEEIFDVKMRLDFDVNMRLDAGGIQELRGYQATERACMSNGNCRIDALDPSGRAYVADVKEGGL
ncbi:MAG: oxalate decarboxylase [Rhodospirillales bacterium]|nr:oxalate decarboxylase [Rhodospirillales bacterium]